jgi:hypothetical protein
LTAPEPTLIDRNGNPVWQDRTFTGVVFGPLYKATFIRCKFVDCTMPQIADSIFLLCDATGLSIDNGTNIDFQLGKLPPWVKPLKSDVLTIHVVYNGQAIHVSDNCGNGRIEMPLTHPA